jgi:hypothetical protein
MDLYQPRGFKATTMMVGDGESPLALCTSWADPWEVATPATVERFSIMAPMRTPAGIEVMLNNLARHPQIRQILLWAGGRLDQTVEASTTRDILLRLFNDGVMDDGLVRGTNFRLNRSLVEDGGLEIVRRIVENVKVVGPVSGLGADFETQMARLSAEKAEYMSPYVFPDLKVFTPESLPSEEVGIMVREGTIFEGWLRLLDRISRYGRNCPLETGGALVRELEFVRVVVEGQSKVPFEVPEWAQNLERLKLSAEKMEKYYREKIRPETYMVEIYPGVEQFQRPREFAYLYAEELHAFPRDNKFDFAVRRIAELGGIGAAVEFLRQVATRPSQNADEVIARVLGNTSVNDDEKVKIILEVMIPPVNQVERVINRIKEMPDDADKVFVLWAPDVHGMRNRARPCWIQGSMLVRNGQIDAKVTFRSHDVGKGWPENVYGIWRLVTDVAQETGYKPGRLIVDSESGHVYQNDIGWVDQLVTSELRDKPAEKVFDRETMGDPRGNWLVALVDGKIVMTLRDPVTSQPLMTLEDKTAKGMMAKLRQLRLVDKPDHALDLGMQLATAEVCRLVGIPFTQDKPVDFRLIRKEIEAD